MAPSTLIRAARIAGSTAAITPTTAARHQVDAHLRPRQRQLGDALVAQRPDHGRAEAGADDDAEQRAEDRDHHRLDGDHPHGLRPAEADRPQQAQLAGALQHRQRQRVDDAQHRDEDRQRQQDLDHHAAAVSSWPVCCVEELAPVADARPPGCRRAAPRPAAAPRRPTCPSVELDERHATAAGCGSPAPPPPAARSRRSDVARRRRCRRPCSVLRLAPGQLHRARCSRRARPVLLGRARRRRRPGPGRAAPMLPAVGVSAEDPAQRGQVGDRGDARPARRRPAPRRQYAGRRRARPAAAAAWSSTAGSKSAAGRPVCVAGDDQVGVDRVLGDLRAGCSWPSRGSC